MNKTSYIVILIFSVFCYFAYASGLSQNGKHSIFKYNKSCYIPDSVYKNRIHALPFECEMFYNASVRKYIELYTIRSKRGTERILGLGTFYFPIIDSIFVSYGIPKEMKYIAIVESSLNPKAVSNGVAGMWQFTKGTGQRFGLTINGVVDERRSIIESTVAVAKYLKLLNQSYSDWRLVLAAYNCGSGGLNHAIRQAGSKSDFWKIYPHLPAYTKNFVPAFMGVAYAFNYYPEYGLKPAACDLPAAMDTIRLSRQLHLQQVSTVLNVDIAMLRSLNPQYLNDLIPANENKTYALYLPANLKTDFLKLQDSVFSYKLTAHTKLPSQTKTVIKEEKTVAAKTIHKVRSGENLYMIARQNNTTVSKLKAWNQLKSDKIQPGQRIVIKGKEMNKS